MKIYSLAAVIGFLFCGCGAAPAAAPPAPVAEKQAVTGKEAVDRWEAAGKINPQHLILKQFAGTWKTKVKAFAGPDIAPEDSTGLAKNSLILGGRYLKEEYKGTAHGKEFQGFGLVGFDNIKGQYVSVWTDTMSTAMMSSRGSYDEKTATLSWENSYVDPITGSEKHGRSIGRIVSPTKYAYEMLEKLADGSEIKILEIEYTKVR